MKTSIFLILSSLALVSCSGADIDVKETLKLHQEQMTQCYNTKDAKLCDTAIATMEKDMPLLKSACSSGNDHACGLFPGYDQAPEALRSYKKICVDNQVDASIPDNFKQMAQQGMKAACDKMKAIGPKS